MNFQSSSLFNPCSLDEDEQIPAKIWEFLRRNEEFREEVRRLIRFDARAKQSLKRIRKLLAQGVDQTFKTPEAAELRRECEKRNRMTFYGIRMLDKIGKRNPFAKVALQWLVPEPLFHCSVAALPLGKKWRKRAAFPVRHLRVGVGTTPNVQGKDWVWTNPNRPDIRGHSIVRGPEIHWTKSRVKCLRSWVNPIKEWREYTWPFTVDHQWLAAPMGFRREFQFIWRNGFDCRPNNPLTKDRRDAPSPFETQFFHDWNIAEFRVRGQVSKDDLRQMNRFDDIARKYRVFAVPKTVLTKGSAESMGKWLSDELKKGSNLYGDLLKERLLNEAELLGTASEWNDWLNREAGKLKGVRQETYFYRRCKYLDSLVGLIYPSFPIDKLLEPPKHRARGKIYVRK